MKRAIAKPPPAPASHMVKAVQTVPLFAAEFHRFLRRIGIGGISGKARPPGPEQGNSLLNSSLVPTNNADLRAFLHKCLSGRQPQSAGAAYHQDPLVDETPHNQRSK